MTLMSVGDCLDLWASRKGGNRAIEDGSRSITWSELSRTSRRIAVALSDRGVRRDDFVAITIPNSVAFFEVAAAVWRLGATPLPLSAKIAEGERDAIMEVVRPAAIVDAEAAAALSSGEGSTEDLPNSVGSHWKALTSGGSTGRPKVIVAAEASAFDPDEPPLLMTCDQVHLVAGPLYHNAAFLFSARALFCGARLVVMQRFDAEQALALIEREKISYTVMVPTMMRRIASLPSDVSRRYDLSSLRTLLHTGAACAPDLKQWWIDRIGGDALQEVFGVTEACGASWVSGTEWLAKPGSVGRPMPGYKVRITDEDGLDLPVGEIGNIVWMPESGPGTTYHYIGGQSQRDESGWEWMGDMGRVDPDGYIYLADRRTDLVISGGANIYPAEVEAVLDAYPGVVASAVIGLPDEDLGQRVHAIVEVSMPIAESELLGYLAGRLTRFKIPRSIEFVSTPLRNEAGKVRRATLRAERMQERA